VLVCLNGFEIAVCKFHPEWVRFVGFTHCGPALTETPHNGEGIDITLWSLRRLALSLSRRSARWHAQVIRL
jgi:hypothetical protein